MLIESETYIAVPPGVAIKEQLERQKIKLDKFSSGMELTKQETEQLIEGEMILTPEIATRLEAALGVPASFWNNLEAIYRDKLEKIEEENAKVIKK